jgi:hypothetical protein
MAKNNLAGLAALGALGMMMSKGKKGADRDTDTGVDVMPSYAARDPLEAANSSQDAMDIRDSLTRGAPGTSETVTPSIKPTASRARATAPSSRSTISIDDEAGISRGTRARDPRSAEAGMSRGTRTTSMAGAGRGSVNPPAASSTPDMSAYVPRRTPGPLADVDRPGNRARYENEDVSDMAYKKGGKTKKMAKGGMTSSASSRADGIASKGKTRGKIC